jgi:hypothetical protein
MHLAGARRIFDAICAIYEIAGPRFHAEPVEDCLAKCAFGAFSKLWRDAYLVGLERPLQGRLELSLRIGSIEFGARYTNPGSAARRPRTDIRRNASVGT